MSSSDRVFPHARYFKVGILITSLSLIVFGRPLLRKRFAHWVTKDLNERAWNATFSERHLPIPAGPRDGYWNSNLHRPIYDRILGWGNVEMHRPGFVDIDAHNQQILSNDAHPNNQLLIMGASVAFGVYASNERQTYFAHCAYHLRALKRRTKITVLAVGGWRSANELAAFRTQGIASHPDVVVFMSGLNDLIQHREVPMAQHVSDFLAHMREARDLALAHHIRVVFAPQPFLLNKKKTTALEKIIERESFRPLSELQQADQQIRTGLQQLTVPGKVFMIDCSDVFDDIPQTTFTDIWHFTDIGQGILGAYLATRLAPLLKP